MRSYPNLRKKTRTPTADDRLHISVWPLLWVRTYDGNTQPIQQYYRLGAFVIHRPLHFHNCWNISHWRTQDLVFPGVPTLKLAVAMVDELMLLTPKWPDCRRRYQLWLEFDQRMNPREKYAVAYFIAEMHKKIARLKREKRKQGLKR